MWKKAKFNRTPDRWCWVKVVKPPIFSWPFPDNFVPVLETNLRRGTNRVFVDPASVTVTAETAKAAPIADWDN